MEKNKEEKLSYALCQMAKTDDMRRHMTQAARQKVAENYSWVEAADQFLKTTHSNA
jgi:glycosyltransferase involved in cell wall biosynthesis